MLQKEAKIVISNFVDRHFIETTALLIIGAAEHAVLCTENSVFRQVGERLPGVWHQKCLIVSTHFTSYFENLGLHLTLDGKLLK